jgi:acyl CoA:acetate/3-ketoacid CoA transferase beta subunit
MGIPTRGPGHIPEARTVVLHSENEIRAATGGPLRTQEDPWLMP